jgi:hypothetical protein
MAICRITVSSVHTLSSFTMMQEIYSNWRNSRCQNTKNIWIRNMLDTVFISRKIKLIQEEISKLEDLSH